jgi:hypothetical protein
MIGTKPDAFEQSAMPYLAGAMTLLCTWHISNARVNWQCCAGELTMDLAATSQDVVPVGPRIYMQVSRYFRKRTTSLCAATFLLLFKYSVTAARMSGCYCRYPPPLRVK